jgi:uncharacterized protein (TIGR01777 family)
MKFLLTGATGFVGRHLVKTLHEQNHDIVVLSRDGAKAKKTLPVYLAAFSWNPETEPAPTKAFDGVDAVIHLAGEGVADHRWTPQQKQKILTSRELGTRNLIATINQLKTKPKVFISTSAIGIYGNRGDEILSEDASLGSGDFLSSVCASWEAEAQNVQNVRLCVVRVGIVLGLDGGALKKMLMPFKLGVGGKLGSGKQWMSWIHVQDLVNLYIHLALTQTASGIFNGVAPTAETNAGFTKILGHSLHRPTFAAVPKLALKLMFGEMSAILLGSQHCVPKAIQNAGFQFKFPTLSEALQNLL